MHLLRLKNVPIFAQLQLEEALLRLDTRNICLINEGSPPAVVMGISGKFDELIDREKLSSLPLPVIKRFSGGGTVVVDEETLFISFLCQKDLHPFHPYPEPIMRWTEEIYRDALKLPTFALRENDYALGEKKFGGNAQYLKKDRWLHHTTLLWNYQQKHMDLLKNPRKQPSYRANRDHEEFITSLSSHLASKEAFITRFVEALSSRFPLTTLTYPELTPLLQKPHRQSTQLIPIKDLCKR